MEFKNSWALKTRPCSQKADNQQDQLQFSPKELQENLYYVFL